MTKDNRKAWMKTATMGWSRDGTMTQETARLHAAADGKGKGGASLRQLISAANCIPAAWSDLYLSHLGKAERDCSPDDVFTLLYAYAWCRAYSRPVADWFNSGGMVCEGAPEQVQLSLAA